FKIAPTAPFPFSEGDFGQIRVGDSRGKPMQRRRLARPAKGRGQHQREFTPCKLPAIIGKPRQILSPERIVKRDIALPLQAAGGIPRRAEMADEPEFPHLQSASRGALWLSMDSDTGAPSSKGGAP